MRNKFILFFVSAVIFYSVFAATAFGASMREGLVAMKNTIYVITVDDTNTYVKPKDVNFKRTKDFEKEFVAFCKSQGQLMSRMVVKDGLTGKETEKWVAINPSEKGWFVDPATKKSVSMFDFKCPKIKIDGIAEFDMRFRSRRGSFGDNIYHLTNLVVHHTTPQPLVYKADDIPETLSEDGLKKPTFVNMYQYMYAKACAPADTHKWVIKNVKGELVEANNVEAFWYISSTKKENAYWYAEISGPKMVVKHAGRQVDIFKDRDMSGINYASAAKESAVRSTSTAAIPSTQTVSQAEKGLALASAMTMTSTTLRSNPTEVLESKYMGTDSSGGHRVAIEKYFAPDGVDQKRLLDSTTYLVKNGQVTPVESEMIHASLIPTEVENLIQGVARETQAKGRGSAIYQDYIVAGKPLRDATKCNVEVLIVKSGALVETRVVNGCN